MGVGCKQKQRRLSNMRIIFVPSFCLYIMRISEYSPASGGAGWPRDV